MADSPQLDEAFALALKLSPSERLRLIARVASSVEPEIAAISQSRERLGDWGAPE